MLSGKTIWLIGASEGIGRALAIQLAAVGANLIVSARNADRLQDLLIALSGTSHRAVACDVTKPDTVKTAWNAVAPQNIDMLIYNAGAYEPIAADQMDLSKIENIIDINLHGALRVLSQVIPSFTARGQGHIALVGSIAGYRGLPGAMGYSLSKAAIINLSECLRCDLQKHNIHVQVINPGFVKTRLTDKNDFQMMNIITPELAARRMVIGLSQRKFEVRFPWALTTLFKFFRLLPYRLYFKIMAKQ